jgi:lipopolysaccharide export system ATP-binding protein
MSDSATLDEAARKSRLKNTLIAQGITKSYKGRTVVDHVSLGLRTGEAVGLLGPNGAGKTTCFYMVTGLVQPDEGTVAIDGNDVTPMPMYQRARLGIGYLPQEASIFRGLSVEKNIMAVLEVSEPDKAVRKEPSISLSGGERRRLEIARALAVSPKFILLDEPFAGVDPIAVGEIKSLVRHLTTRGIGVLITDHNVRETLNTVDRAYIIHAGRVLTQGTPKQIVEHPEARRVYLGEEFTF